MKLICIGRNYTEHAKELGNAVPERPVIFLKPDTAVLKGKDFYIPEFSREVHHEVEVLVKISKSGKYIQPENAYKHYDEIGLGLDFTARDLQAQLKAAGLPWEIAKGFDGSAVLSDFFPKSDYTLDRLTFSLEKNGEVVQKGNTAHMLFSIDAMLAYVSQFFTLRVGDVLFTGTPAGVSAVTPGDALTGHLAGKEVFQVFVH